VADIRIGTGWPRLQAGPPLRDARMFLPGYLGRTRREALEREPW